MLTKGFLFWHNRHLQMVFRGVQLWAILLISTPLFLFVLLVLLHFLR